MTLGTHLFQSAHSRALEWNAKGAAHHLSSALPEGTSRASVTEGEMWATSDPTVRREEPEDWPGRAPSAQTEAEGLKWDAWGHR